MCQFRRGARGNEKENVMWKISLRLEFDEEFLRHACLLKLLVICICLCLCMWMHWRLWGFRVIKISNNKDESFLEKWSHLEKMGDYGVIWSNFEGLIFSWSNLFSVFVKIMTMIFFTRKMTIGIRGFKYIKVDSNWMDTKKSQ